MSHRLRSIHAMLRASVRMVCRPSASCKASPGFRQFLAQGQVRFILKYADTFFPALVATDTPLHGTVADVDDFSLHAFFFQRSRHFRKFGKRISTAMRTSVYQQHFQSLVLICSNHNCKAISPSAGHSVRRTGSAPSPTGGCTACPRRST